MNLLMTSMLDVEDSELLLEGVVVVELFVILFVVVEPRTSIL